MSTTVRISLRKKSSNREISGFREASTGKSACISLNQDKSIMFSSVGGSSSTVMVAPW